MSRSLIELLSKRSDATEKSRPPSSSINSYTLKISSELYQDGDYEDGDFDEYEKGENESTSNLEVNELFNELSLPRPIDDAFLVSVHNKHDIDGTCLFIPQSAQLFLMLIPHFVPLELFLINDGQIYRDFSSVIF